MSEEKISARAWARAEAARRAADEAEEDSSTTREQQRALDAGAKALRVKAILELDKESKEEK